VPSGSPLPRRRRLRPSPPYDLRVPDPGWAEFLDRWSSEWLSSGADQLARLPEEVRGAGYLGFDPASEQQLEVAERRLGVELPPSYKDFLGTSNGWRLTSPFIYRVWPVEKIEWFRVRNRDWIDAWQEAWPDAPGDWEGTQMEGTLEVSDEGDSAILLLNPGTVDDDTGEWEAWFFSNWGPGAKRYRSFRALMEAEYETFLRLVPRA
jgi:SMI1 / KNR4 family (SUKH-1)